MNAREFLFVMNRIPSWVSFGADENSDVLLKSRFDELKQISAAQLKRTKNGLIVFWSVLVAITAICFIGFLYARSHRDAVFYLGIAIISIASSSVLYPLIREEKEIHLSFEEERLFKDLKFLAESPWIREDWVVWDERLARQSWENSLRTMAMQIRNLEAGQEGNPAIASDNPELHKMQQTFDRHYDVLVRRKVVSIKKSDC